MYDVELVLEILHQILDAGKRIERRFSPVKQPDEFLATDDGLDRLDAICMMLIAIGESRQGDQRRTPDQVSRR